MNNISNHEASKRDQDWNEAEERREANRKFLQQWHRIHDELDLLLKRGEITKADYRKRIHEAGQRYRKRINEAGTR